MGHSLYFLIFVSIFRLNRVSQSSRADPASRSSVRGMECSLRRICPASSPQAYCPLSGSIGTASSAPVPSIQLWTEYTPSSQTPKARGLHMGTPRAAAFSIIRNSVCFLSYWDMGEMRRKYFVPWERPSSGSAVAQYFRSSDQPS